MWSTSRSVLDLGGAWQFSTAEPHDGSDWLTMEIPSNWHRAGLANHAGVVWFQTAFARPIEDAAAWWLRFEGVDYYCDVWLNGHRLGRHEGYFQPFEHEVSQLLEDDNLLRVRVDAPYEAPGAVWPTRKTLVKGVLNHHDCRPGANDPRWGQDGGTGGIWNRVLLYASARQRLQRVAVSSHRVADGAAVRVRCEAANLDGGTSLASLHVELLDGDGQTVGSRAREAVLGAGITEHEFVFTLRDYRAWETWDRGGPCLYRCRVRLGGLEAVETTFGIREVRIDEGWRWTLNGRAFFPRGTNIIPTQWLASYRPEDVARDVDLLREANVNAVRVHAHVTRPEFYAACDAAGILVWQDFPLQWGYEESDDFRAGACAQIRDMARILYNHPAVAVWCCHNEPTHNRHTLDPLLEAAIREVDASRPVIAASDFQQHPYPGWYYGHVEHYRGLPAAPFISEYGAQALPSADAVRDMVGEANAWPQTVEQWERWAYHGFQHDQTFRVAGIECGRTLEEFVANSQAYQYHLIKLATEVYRCHKYDPITGLFHFMFVDCWPSITWSVLDHARRPKKGFDALRLAFQPVLVSLLGGQGPDRGTLEARSLWSVLTLCAPVIVNDTLVHHAEARLEISMLRADQRWTLHVMTVDVPPDSVVRPVSPMELLERPEKQGWKEAWRPVYEQFCTLDPGRYQVHLALEAADGRLLSHNHEDVELVAPVVPSPFQL